MNNNILTEGQRIHNNAFSRPNRYINPINDKINRLNAIRIALKLYIALRQKIISNICTSVCNILQ